MAASIPLSHGLLAATATLGDDGVIHVAGYDDQAVRYLQIGR